MAGADTGAQGSPAPAPAPSGDPSAQPVSIMGQATPDDVQAGKLRLNPYVVQMTAAIASCSAKVPPAMQAAWASWAANWAAFYASPSSAFKASSDMDRIVQCRAELTSFENQLLKICPDAGIVSLDAEPPGTFARIGSAITSITTLGAILIVAGTGLVGWLIYQNVREGYKTAPKLVAAATKVLPFV